MNSREKQELLERVTVESQDLHDEGWKITVTWDIDCLMILIAQLQLALRHPQNVGPSAQVTRSVLQKLIDELPVDSLALRELANKGNDPKHDL